MVEMHQVELKGQRVLLVPLERGHTQELFEIGKHPEIWAYMLKEVRTYSDMLQMVEDHLLAKEKKQVLPFVIIDLYSNSIVGYTRFFNISSDNRSLEIGSWLSPGFWGTGINTESKYLLLQYCFETLFTNRVELKADSRNIRSQKAIERIGATKEGILRRHCITHEGYIRDSVIYSVIQEEWAMIKRMLEALVSTRHSFSYA